MQFEVIPTYSDFFMRICQIKLKTAKNCCEVLRQKIVFNEKEMNIVYGQ